jgi:DNA repair exonuclease SbcCD ATPase subunit
MRLLSVGMHGFRGCAEDTKVEFGPGLNVFCGANEAGKTTLVLAIHYALYLPRTELERLACVAEGKDLCRIWLDYELSNGARYRLERDLIAHRHALSRWDGHGWSQESTQLGDIARTVQAHTGCDQAFFERSLLVRHETIEVPPTDDLAAAVATRLEILIGGQSKITAVKAVAKLDQKLKALTGPRAGEISTTTGRLQDSRRRLVADQLGQRDLVNNRAALGDVEQGIKRLDEESQTISAVLARHRGVQDMERVRADKFGRRSVIDRALDAQKKAKELASELRELEAKRPARVVPPPSWRWLASLAAGGALLIAGLAATIWWNRLAGILAIPGLLLMWLGWRRRPTLPALDKATVEYEVQIRELERQVAAANAVAETLSIQGEAELRSERAALSRDLEELETRAREEAAFRLPPEEVERFTKRLDVLAREAPAAREQRAVLLSKVEAGTREDESISELEDEVEVLERQVRRLRVRAEATALARDELQAALEEVRNAVGPRIAATATRHLQAVVPGYGVMLSDMEGLTFLPTWADGRPFGRRALSDGTADQFYLAVRIALAQELLRDHRPPLILDDPFQYCDPSRRAALYGLLSDVAKERQVLYFTIDDPLELQITHRL